MLLHWITKRFVARIVVAHQLHHVLLELRLGVGVLLTQLLEDQLLGQGSGHAEPQELLEDQWFILWRTHLPLVKITALGILQ